MIRTKRPQAKKTGNKTAFERNPYYANPPKGHRFQKGNKAAVGHGRPRTGMLTKELDRQLRIADKKGVTEKEKFIKQIIIKAKGKGPGNAALANLILDRIDGKVLQTIAGPDGGPIPVTSANVQLTKLDLSKMTDKQLDVLEELGLLAMFSQEEEGQGE